MQRYFVLMILILCVVSTLMAVPYEQTEEYRQKQAILNERAARFKAETGFEGSIIYNHQYMNFSSFTGSFRDIEAIAPQDSVHMREIFTQVLTKVMPYIDAKENQLHRGQLSKNMFGVSVAYSQIVNGYPVVGAGSLRISYLYQSEQLSINNSTVRIYDDRVLALVTKEEVVEIYAELVDGDEQANLYSNRPPKFRLAYCNIHEYRFDVEPDYRLCWVGGSKRKLVIDAVSGKPYINEIAVVHDLDSR